MATKKSTALATQTAAAPKAATKLSKAPVKESIKPKKPKLVRDSFTIPEAEYKILSTTKKMLIESGFEVKKTELLRVGLALLGKASPTTLKRQLKALTKLKAGRPSKR